MKITQAPTGRDIVSIVESAMVLAARRLGHAPNGLYQGVCSQQRGEIAATKRLYQSIAESLGPIVADYTFQELEIDRR